MIKEEQLKYSLLLFLSIILIICACEVINPDETIPSHMSIHSINLQTDYSLQGTNSNKITDAWVYVDDQLIGAFELPATFPVLMTGIHQVVVRPGIKVNGINATRGSYPFYQQIEINNKNLPEGEILYLDSLETSYVSYTDFAWMEDFEDGGVSIEPTSRSDTGIQKTSVIENIFEGGYSGIVYLDSDNSFFELKTSDAYVLPKSSAPVFLELNYKSNNIFTIGVFANSINESTQHSILIINKSEVWNKIYVNLTNRVSTETSAIDFQIFFGGIKDDDVTFGKIILDNIKLIH
ncbi:hypothetical protein ACFLRZ_02015 [Bacteroidota bacterium]